jgi:flagellar protein FlgJ
MNLHAVPTPTAWQDVPLDLLARDKALTPQQKVAEACRQFEALMIGEILRQTQKTVIPSEFTDDSTAAGIYQDMVTKQLAESISRSGTLGLAQTLERQLTRQMGASHSTASDQLATASHPLPRVPGRPVAAPRFEPERHEP